MDRQVNMNPLYRNATASRAQRPDVREERLETPVRNIPGVLACTAWRGRSGRRYACMSYNADSRAIDSDRSSLVVIALRRDAQGRAELIGVRALRDPADFPAMQARIVAAGASEIAIYALCDDLEEADAVAADLKPLRAPLDPAPAPAVPEIVIPKRRRTGNAAPLRRTRRHFGSC